MSDPEDYSGMKAWPADPDETVDFGDLVDPLKKALYQLYYLAPRHPEAKYEGYNIGVDELPCTPKPDWRLSREGIEIHRLKGCGTPVDAILETAVQLGIEQGRRMRRKDERWARKAIERLLAMPLSDDARREVEHVRFHLEKPLYREDPAADAEFLARWDAAQKRRDPVDGNTGGMMTEASRR